MVRLRVKPPAPTGASERDIARIRLQGYNYEVGFPIAGIAGLAVPVLTPKGRPLDALALGATGARLPAERLDTVLAIILEEANRIRSAAGSSRAILEGR